MQLLGFQRQVSHEPQHVVQVLRACAVVPVDAAAVADPCERSQLGQLVFQKVSGLLRIDVGGGGAARGAGLYSVQPFGVLLFESWHVTWLDG